MFVFNNCFDFCRTSTRRFPTDSVWGWARGRGRGWATRGAFCGYGEHFVIAPPIHVVGTLRYLCVRANAICLCDCASNCNRQRGVPPKMRVSDWFLGCLQLRHCRWHHWYLDHPFCYRYFVKLMSEEKSWLSKSDPSFVPVKFRSRGMGWSYL